MPLWCPLYTKESALIWCHTSPSLCSQLYVTGCIEVLMYVRTPWSESVEELVQRCLKVDHPHVAMLEKQYHLLQLKKLLHGYGIKGVNFSDTTSSFRWVSWT